MCYIGKSIKQENFIKRQLQVPIYHSTVIFVDDFDQAKKFCQASEFIEDCKNGSAGFTLVDECGTILLCVTDGDLSTLVHELSHVAYFILDHVGVEHDPEAHESYSYLLAFLFDKTRGWL